MNTNSDDSENGPMDLRKSLRERIKFIEELESTIMDLKGQIYFSEMDAEKVQFEMYKMEKRLKKAIDLIKDLGGNPDLLKTILSDSQCPDCGNKDDNAARFMSSADVKGSPIEHCAILVPLRVLKCVKCDQEWIEQ